MATKPFQLCLSDGRVFPARGDHTLLRQLNDAGCKVPLACSNGHCGRCHAALLAGETQPPAKGRKIALCTHYPRSDVELILPERPQWQRCVCFFVAQQERQLTLRLPAGQLALAGDQWLVVVGKEIRRARLVSRQGRLLVLELNHTLLLAADALPEIFNVESLARARGQLRDGAHILLTGISARVAREIQNSLLQSGLTVNSD